MNKQSFHCHIKLSKRFSNCKRIATKIDDLGNQTSKRLIYILTFKHKKNVRGLESNHQPRECHIQLQNKFWIKVQKRTNKNSTTLGIKQATFGFLNQSLNTKQTRFCRSENIFEVGHGNGMVAGLIPDFVVRISFSYLNFD